MTKQIHFFLLALFTLLCFSVFGQDDVIFENTKNNIPAEENPSGFGDTFLYDEINNIYVTKNDENIIFTYRKETNGDLTILASEDFSTYDYKSTNIFFLSNPTESIELSETNISIRLSDDYTVENDDSTPPLLMGYNSSTNKYIYGIYRYTNFSLGVGRYYYFVSPNKIDIFINNTTNFASEADNNPAKNEFSKIIIKDEEPNKEISLSIYQDGGDVYKVANDNGEMLLIMDNPNFPVYTGNDGSGTYYYYLYEQNSNKYQLYKSSSISLNSLNSVLSSDHIIAINSYNVEFNFTDKEGSRNISSLIIDEINGNLIAGYSDQNLGIGQVEIYSFVQELLDIGQSPWDQVETLTSNGSSTEFGKVITTNEDYLYIGDNEGILIFSYNAGLYSINDKLYPSFNYDNIKSFDSNGISDNTLLIWNKNSMSLYHPDSYGSNKGLSTINHSFTSSINSLEILQDNYNFVILCSFDNSESILTLPSIFPSSGGDFPSNITFTNSLSSLIGTVSTNEHLAFSKNENGLFTLTRNDQKINKLEYNFDTHQLNISPIGKVPYSDNISDFGKNFSMSDYIYINHNGQSITSYYLQFITDTNGDWHDALNWKYDLQPFNTIADRIVISNDMLSNFSIVANTLTIDDGKSLKFRDIEDAPSEYSFIGRLENRGILNVGDEHYIEVLNSGNNYSTGEINLGINDNTSSEGLISEFIYTSENNAFNNEGSITVNDKGRVKISGDWTSTNTGQLIYTESGGFNSSDAQLIIENIYEKVQNVDIGTSYIPYVSIESHYDHTTNIDGTFHISSYFVIDENGNYNSNLENITLYVDSPITNPYYGNYTEIYYEDIEVKNLIINTEDYEFYYDQYGYFKVNNNLTLNYDLDFYGTLTLTYKDGTEAFTPNSNKIIYPESNEFNLEIDLSDKPSSLDISLPFEVAYPISDGVLGYWDSSLDFDINSISYNNDGESFTYQIEPFIEQDIESYILNDIEYYSYRNRNWTFHLNDGITSLSGDIHIDLENAIPYVTDNINEYYAIAINGETISNSEIFDQSNYVFSNNEHSLSTSVNITAAKNKIALTSINSSRLLTSIQDGDWNAPETWNSYTVPSDGDSIVIKHNIDLSNSDGGLDGQVGKTIDGDGMIGMMIGDGDGPISVEDILVKSIHITSRDEGGETAYGELVVYPGNNITTETLTIDENCLLDVGPTATLISSNENDLSDIINGEITLYNSDFFSSNTIALNGTITDTGVENGYISNLTFQGSEITGNGSISVSSFLITEERNDDTRIVNIDVPLNILRNGSLDSEGPLTIHFNDLVTFEEDAFINTMGYVTFNGSTESSDDILNLLPIYAEGEEDNFISLTINDYNTVNFSNTTTISENLNISNTNNVYLDQEVSLTINPTYEGKEVIPNMIVLLFDNVTNVNGFDQYSEINVSLDNGTNQIKPQILNTSFTNINFTGDSVFLIKPTTISNLAGYYIELVKDPELLNKVIYDEIEEQSFIDTRVSPNDDSVRFLVTIPTDGSYRVLHDDEDLIIKYGTSEITNFKIGATKTISGEVSVTYNWVGIPVSELQRVNVDFTSTSLELNIASKHKTFTGEISNYSTIEFDVIPSNYIVNEDLALLKTFIENLEYNVGDIESNFSITSEDLNALGNSYSNDSFLDQITDIDNRGRITALNLENRNISEFSLADLQPSPGGLFPPNEEGLPSISITGMENLNDIVLNRNHLDFGDDDLSSNSFTIIYTPTSPFINKTSYKSTLTIGGENNFTFDDQYNGKSYSWFRQDKNDNSVYLELDQDYVGGEGIEGGNILPLTNIDSAGTYKVIVENPEAVIGLQLEFEVEVTIEQGEFEKTALENFLNENGKSGEFDPTDNMRDWFSTDNRFVIDDYGRVTEMDLSSFGLENVTGLLESGSPRFSDQLTKINIDGNDILFGNLENISSEITSYSALNLTIGNQNYKNISTTPELVELVHGENDYNSSIDYSVIYDDTDNKLTYNWFKNESLDNTITGSQLSLSTTESDNVGQYQLKLSHADYSGLFILIKEFDVTYAKGAQDSVALKNILAHVDPTLDLTGEMRNWVSAETATINDFGEVEALNLSEKGISSLINDFGDLDALITLNLSGNTLDDISLLLNLENLTTLDVSNNNLFFDDIQPLVSGETELSGTVTYSPQTYDFGTIETTNVELASEEVITADVTSFNAIENLNLTYQWVKEDDSPADNTTNNVITVSSYLASDLNAIETYKLIASSTDEGLENLEIQIDELKIQYILGTSDKIYLRDFLTNLNDGFSPTNENMREWENDEHWDTPKNISIIINDLGEVKQLDLSNRALESINTSDLNLLSKLTHLDISDNNLFFDEILPFISNSYDEFNYSNQSYATLQDASAIEHGTTDFTFDGTIENDESLTYQWVRQSDSEVVSNTASFAINPMTINNESIYSLFVEHNDIPNLSLEIHQYDVSHVLGTAEKDELKILLTELGIDTDASDDMRLWDENQEIVTIDSAGYVLEIDISNRSLITIPSNINDFTKLENFNVSDNQLFFDEILPFISNSFDEFNYSNQSYATLQGASDIEHGATDFTFDGTIENDESLTYQWVRQSDSEVVSNTASFAINPMTINNESIYSLFVEHNDIPNLSLEIHQYDVSHVLGTAEKDELKILLTELGVNTDNEDMHLWDPNKEIVNIDSTGFVIRINLSGKDLENLPANLSDFKALDTLDVSENNLFFDEILTVDQSGLVEFNYSNQTYPLLSETKDVDHGSEFTFDGKIDNDGSLTYQWIRESNNEVVSNSSNLVINPMTINDSDTYILSVKHDDIDDLWINIYQYDVNHILGTADQEDLKILLTELGINTDHEDMHQWDPNKEIVNIDSAGFVIRIDLSGKELEELPNYLNDFTALDTIDVSDNNLFFDDIEPYLGYNISYQNQTYNFTTISDTLSYGDSYAHQAQLEGYESLEYRWTNTSGVQLGNSSLYKIDFATGDSTGIINLNVSNPLFENLNIKIAELNLAFTLGNEDSLLVKQMLEEIGYTNYSSQSDFRTWIEDRTTIDNYGRLITLDLSSFEIDDDENLLSSLPSQLTLFEYLTSIEVQNNNLDFNDLEGFESIENSMTYAPQTSEIFSEQYFVIQYDNFERVFNLEENVSYNWIFNNDTLSTSNDASLNVSSFDPSKEGVYTLLAKSNDSNWNALEITLGTISLNYQSLISEEDSVALYELFSAMNVTFDETVRIIDWPRLEYNNDGEITSLFLHELEDVTELPDIIGQFKALETLKLYDSGIENISDSLWTITALEYLDLSNNNLEDNDVTGLEQINSLTTLWLSINKLTVVPPIQNNTNLRYFIADDNQITSIGNEFDNLLNLLDLSLAGNILETITTEFTNLISLKKIDLSRNNLTNWEYNLPNSVEELLLYSNMLTTLENVPNDIYVNVSDNFLFFNDLTGFTKEFLNYSPQRFNVHYENVGMTEGETYTFGLPIDQSENLVYLWFKDGVIQSDINGDTLTIENMTNNDAGVYTCYISNTYWDELSIQIAQISLGMDCGSNFNVSLQSNSNEWFCYGDDVEVQIEAITTNSNLTYNWYKGDELLSLLNTSIITVHEEGIYSLKIQNSNGCITFSDSLEVKIASPMIAPEIIESSDSLTVSSVDQTLQYFWYLDGELLEQNGTTIIKLNSGNYTVEVMNEAGCSVLSNGYTVDPSGVVTDLEDELSFISLFPQPANNILNIHRKSNSLSIENLKFIDISGKSSIPTFNFNNNRIEISTSTLKNGVYILEITEKNGDISYHKIMITH